ncbi:hypothetical protein [Paenibacillus sinopodophylli]|uniref:hypothetical protein n=1 Tax=Paenibacillus sinopodophylli TaxID=1837342 RepID=UPI00110CBAE3|nr:hypothetical protein [Paenibacillus sinopodophylli]
MNCNCLSEIKARLKDELPKQDQYAKLKIISVDFSNAAFLMNGNRIESTLSTPITITHEPIGRKKSTNINMTISYCPFCGKSAKEESEQETA